MKKFMLLSVVCLALLCGCQSNHSNENDINEIERNSASALLTMEEEEWDAVKKAQELRVLKASEVVETIQSEKEIEQFVTDLDIEHWIMESMPQNAIAEGTFEFYQTPTQKFGETKPDQTLYKILELMVYKDMPYLSLVFDQELTFKLTFRVPDKTYETLQSYFK